jgi:hypothetical protein
VSPNDLKIAKKFMTKVTKGSQGTLKNSPLIELLNGEKVRVPTLRYVNQRWKDFISAWPQREGNNKIPLDVTESITHVQ